MDTEAIKAWGESIQEAAGELGRNLWSASEGLNEASAAQLARIWKGFEDSQAPETQSFAELLMLKDIAKRALECVVGSNGGLAQEAYSRLAHISQSYRPLLDHPSSAGMLFYEEEASALIERQNRAKGDSVLNSILLDHFLLGDLNPELAAMQELSRQQRDEVSATTSRMFFELVSPPPSESWLKRETWASKNVWFSPLGEREKRGKKMGDHLFERLRGLDGVSELGWYGLSKLARASLPTTGLLGLASESIDSSSYAYLDQAGAGRWDKACAEFDSLPSALRQGHAQEQIALLASAALGWAQRMEEYGAEGLKGKKPLTLELAQEGARAKMSARLRKRQMMGPKEEVGPRWQDTGNWGGNSLRRAMIWLSDPVGMLSSLPASNPRSDFASSPLEWVAHIHKELGKRLRMDNAGPPSLSRHDAAGAALEAFVLREGLSLDSKLASDDASPVVTRRLRL